MSSGATVFGQQGTTPVLTSDEATARLEAIDVSSVVGLRDRALLAVMIYTFARFSAVVGLTPLRTTSHRKIFGGSASTRKTARFTNMPCHPKLAGYLDVYIEAADIHAGRRGPLFRGAKGKTKTLTSSALSRKDAWCLVGRRADAGILTSIGCHTFRATGITGYLTHGGRIEVAQRMAGHANAKTTGLYDRRNDDVDLSEVAKIGI
jgi:integrase/recombinase XerD